MNNCLLFALISLIVYIPSFNASGSYSSSSLGGRRRSGKGGKTAPAGYGGNDGKGRPTGSGKHTDGAAGSDGKLDKDYRDIIEYISKEFNKDKGSDYTKDKYGLGTSYPRGRNDDYRNDDYRNDGYRNGALSSGLLLQLTETIHEQAGLIAALKQDAEQSKEDLEELEATQYHLIGYIITLSKTLEQLIDDLRSVDITPPSVGINYYICTESSHPESQCEVGSLVAMAGALTTDQMSYLKPADGSQITDNNMPGVCDQLSGIYGDAEDTSESTCLSPDLSGKYLVGTGGVIDADLGECVGSNVLDFTGEGYHLPAYPKPPPKSIVY